MPPPRMLMCYLCGREFGSASLGIHIPQCQAKWLAQEELKPKKERRALPKEPAALTGGAMPKGEKAIEEFNNKMYDQFESGTLQHCEYCGRSFRDEAFKKHQSLCTADKPFKPAGTGLGAQSLSTKLEPGLVSGTAHAKAVLPERPKQEARSAVDSLKKDTNPALSKSLDSAKASAAPKAKGCSSIRASMDNGYPAERPRAYTCYLCGQQYGSKSLPIHIPQCQEKWVKVEEQKLKKERRPVPPPPPELTDELPTDPAGIDAFNDAMYGYWSKVSLVKCAGCGRTFRPEALEHHRKACSGGGAPVNVMAGTGGFNDSLRPRGFTCYLCGQQYGSASLAIHIPQCQAKWLAVEAQKPKNERRALPPQPAAITETLPTSAAAIDAFNNQSFDTYNTQALVPCEYCGRTFLPDALKHHSKACTADKPMARKAAKA
ncbi:hypothetical protein WJX72_004195 [[Myrmecia] bisecta]|uniref:C2HC/C3H-type domain-containing protein n=1 Tax=[Myrmecia] bisecta TaxID=41462 RepID=A0AAW1PJW8_9CHLO